MKVYKKGDVVKLAPHDYLQDRQHLRGVIIEVRDKGDNIVPIHRIWWAIKRKHEWHYAEDICLL